MKILAHRGYWKTKKEQNTSIAFERSFSLGLGIETDIRDHLRKVVVSHDMATGKEISLSSLLSLSASYHTGQHLTLALNIKSDGLAHSLNHVSTYPQLDCFVFDMSVPDMRSYLDLGIPTFTRMSEVESHPIWLDDSSGVWLDSFETEWFDNSLIQMLMRQGKRVCIVSSEIHQRDHIPLWMGLRSISNRDQLLLCTDIPEKAADFFQKQ